MCVDYSGFGLQWVWVTVGVGYSGCGLQWVWVTVGVGYSGCGLMGESWNDVNNDIKVEIITKTAIMTCVWVL